MRGRVGLTRRIGVATGAVIGSALWLTGAGSQVHAADLPCRTPCLAVPAPAPEPAPPSPAPVKPPTAPKPVGKPKPASAPREAAAPLPAPPARPARVASPRCTAITLRAQVGEPVSASDMAYLRSEC